MHEVLNDLGARAWSFIEPGWEIGREWLTSPAAWSQFALLALAWLAAHYTARRAKPLLARLISPPEDQTHILARSRRFLLIFLPLLLPLLAWGFTAIGEQVTRQVFGSGAVIAFGKRVVLLLAARILVKDIISDPFLKLLGRYLLVPAAALNALGLLDPVMVHLEGMIVSLGSISFSVLAILRGVIAGSILFWLGRWSNDQTAGFIHANEELRPATRTLAAKAAEVAIFGTAFLLLMNIMGISLTSLAVIGGAVGVGLGFGLQQIAANFISGVILLLEGQATVGDFVELDGGEAGTIVRMTARAIILETFDGKWIVVPNEHFITTRVVNYSDSGSANRYEAPFSVSYDTDINKVPEIVETAVAKLDFVLDAPEGPDCELAGFGESGIDFRLEFWVNGIDDGKNKYASRVLFAIWNALKDAGVEIPYPHRVIELKQPPAS
ncbi:MAG: mechanosensitive ion channel protein MscS [Rhodobacterales bacterium]|nr:MAG: mechanosensitive ion channel protein MscS [Rhodobacterales bacterium]